MRPVVPLSDVILFYLASLRDLTWNTRGSNGEISPKLLQAALKYELPVVGFPNRRGSPRSPCGPAEDLDGYLEELKGFQVDLGNDQTLNFAEAALVIQGSAHVYGRKVDYLRALAQDAYDFVFERKGKGTRKGGRRNGAPGEGGGLDSDPWDVEENFLMLDDLVEEAEDVDLDEDEDGCPGEVGGEGATAPHQSREMPAILSLLRAGAEEKDGAAPRIASFAVHG